MLVYILEDIANGLLIVCLKKNGFVPRFCLKFLKTPMLVLVLMYLQILVRFLIFLDFNYQDFSDHDLNSVLVFPKCSSTDYMMIDLEPELVNISICLWVQTADSFNFGTLFSYASRSNDNEFTLTDYNGWGFIFLTYFI